MSVQLYEEVTGSMPTYEYLCKTCSHRFETWQKMTDEPLTTCPECGAHIRRVLFPAGVVFKGSGFYKTDHSSDTRIGKSDEAPKTETSSTATATESNTSSEKKATDSGASSKSESKVPAGTSDKVA